MPDIYGAYKPLRNYLKKVDLIKGLGAIRWYVNYFQLKNPQAPPAGMEIDPAFWKSGFTIFLPWQMAALAREVIISSDLGDGDDLGKLRHMASALNKLKDIDNYVSQEFVDQTNIMHVVSKVMAHQQFMWQENKPNSQTWARYFAIYGHSQLRPIFEHFFGMSIEKYFVFGMLLWNNYTDYLGINYPPHIDLKPVGGTLADYDLFLKHYSLPLSELRAKLSDPEERRIDHDFFSYYDSLKRFPVILAEVEGKPTHICPVPTYLYWRNTDGIYYELLKEKGFDQALGEAYKSYVGDVLTDQAYSRPTVVLDADSFVKASLPKPDWILIDSEHAAFIECKAKRMTIGAKNEINFSPVTETQLKKLAESVVQCYKAVLSAISSNYKEMAAVKHYHPMVATMEAWYIVGDVAAKLRDLVLQEATSKGVDASFVAANPYLVLSSYEFENLVAVLRKKPLSEVVPPFFADSQYYGWQFDTYLHQAFREECSGYRVFQADPLKEALEKLAGQKLEAV